MNIKSLPFCGQKYTRGKSAGIIRPVFLVQNSAHRQDVFICRTGNFNAVS